MLHLHCELWIITHTLTQHIYNLNLFDVSFEKSNVTITFNCQ